MEWPETIIFLIQCPYYTINEIKHEKPLKDSNGIDTLGQIPVVFPIIVILLNIKLGRGTAVVSERSLPAEAQRVFSHLRGI